MSFVVASIFMGALGTVTEAALICYLIELDAGVPPRDAALNHFMYDLANKDKKQAMLAEFKNAGGRNLGSKYDDPHDDMY